MQKAETKSGIVVNNRSPVCVLFQLSNFHKTKIIEKNHSAGNWVMPCKIIKLAAASYCLC